MWYFPSGWSASKLIYIFWNVAFVLCLDTIIWIYICMVDKANNSTNFISFTIFFLLLLFHSSVLFICVNYLSLDYFLGKLSFKRNNRNWLFLYHFRDRLRFFVDIHKIYVARRSSKWKMLSQRKMSIAHISYFRCWNESFFRIICWLI